VTSLQREIEFRILHVPPQGEDDETPSEQRQQHRRPALAVAELHPYDRVCRKSGEKRRDLPSFRLDFAECPNHLPRRRKHRWGVATADQSSLPGPEERVLGRGFGHENKSEFLIAAVGSAASVLLPFPSHESRYSSRL
jgi:hypothetical protein